MLRISHYSNTHTRTQLIKLSINPEARTFMQFSLHTIRLHFSARPCSLASINLCFFSVFFFVSFCCKPLTRWAETSSGYNETVCCLCFLWYTCESCYFSILRAILLKLHIYAHLIESYSTVYGMSSCIKKMSMSLAAHTTDTMYACRKMPFFAVSNALILQSYIVSC